MCKHSGYKRRSQTAWFSEWSEWLLLVWYSWWLSMLHDRTWELYIQLLDFVSSRIVGLREDRFSLCKITARVGWNFWTVMWHQWTEEDWMHWCEETGARHGTIDGDKPDGLADCKATCQTVAHHWWSVTLKMATSATWFHLLHRGCSLLTIPCCNFPWLSTRDVRDRNGVKNVDTDCQATCQTVAYHWWSVTLKMATSAIWFHLLHRGCSLLTIPCCNFPWLLTTDVRDWNSAKNVDTGMMTGIALCSWTNWGSTYCTMIDEMNPSTETLWWMALWG